MDPRCLPPGGRWHRRCQRGLTDRLEALVESGAKLRRRLRRLPVSGEVARSARGLLHDAAIDRPKACIDARHRAGTADSERLRASSARKRIYHSLESTQQTAPRQIPVYSRDIISYIRSLHASPSENAVAPPAAVPSFKAYP